MEKHSLSFLSLHLLLIITLFTFNQSVISSNFSPLSIAEDLCKLIYCGAGTCEPSIASFYGFECVCNPGWKTIQIFPMPFPSCLMPNCTVDLGCGNGAPPAPPPAFSLPPPLNFSSPCNFVWCGDEGTCVANGTSGHICQCNEGFVNLFNDPNWFCIEQCYFEADCSGLGLGSPPPPPPPTSAAQPGNGMALPGNGFGSTKWSTNLRQLVVMLLSAILLTWI